MRLLPTGTKIGYARVSSNEQTTALQIAALEKEGCDVIFEETVSGAKQKRPALEECLAHIQELSIKEGLGNRGNPGAGTDGGITLYVWKLDRLGRTAWELSNILHDLELWGVRFKCLTQSFDTGDYLGRFLLGQLGLIAQLERDMLIERTKAGQRVAREKGHFSTRPRVLRGERLQRALEAYNTRPIDPSTGRKITVDALAKQFGVARVTFLRYVKHGGLPASDKDRARFLARNPDPALWLEKSDDPLYGRNREKLQRRSAS